MPREAFFNLKTEKRERIVDAGIDEFAEYGYQPASISRIVERADIAKGSFYHYFEDKKDLFKYILQLLGDMKLKILGPVLMEAGSRDFFDTVRDMYLNSIRWVLQEPKLMRISQSVMLDRELRNEVLEDNQQKAINYYLSLINIGVARGDLRQDLDRELTAHILLVLQFAMVDIYYEKHGQEIEETAFMSLAEKILNTIAIGIRNNQPSRRELLWTEKL
jgi:AcrR family transcriptional regulator